MISLDTYKHKIKLLVISDLHLCNIYDRVDLLNEAYIYAAKNKIKNIINLGDVIDSVMPHNTTSIKENSIYKQVDYLLNNYPTIKNIKTYILYGNHDYYSLHKDNIDISKLIEKERHDLINLGYGEAYISILDNPIKLSHRIDYLKDYKKDVDTILNLVGHAHKFKITTNDEYIYVYAPSLSSVKPQGQVENIPGILDVTIEFKNNIISRIYIKNINIEKKQLTSECDFNLNISENTKQKILSKIKSN